MTENEIGREVVDAAIELHRELGPGLLESVYESVLVRLLTERGIEVERQVSIPVTFRNMRFEEGFRADIIAGRQVILELKSVEVITRAHQKQLLTYLRLTGLKLGFVLNFGEELMKNGIKRIINGELSS